MKCISPLRIKNLHPTPAHPQAWIDVPCGKCAYCLARKRREWTGRMLAECKTSVSSFFVTCTFSDDNQIFKDGVAVLDKSVIQSFLKRFRKYLDTYFHAKFRYFLAAEYGSHTFRPHFHFSAFLDKCISFEELSRALKNCWKAGFSYSGTLTAASCMYVAKYCLKDSPSCAASDLVPPFTLKSQGLGREFFSCYRDFYSNSLRTSLFLNGDSYPLSRYQKLHTLDSVHQLRYNRKVASVIHPYEDADYGQYQGFVNHVDFIKQSKLHKL